VDKAEAEFETAVELEPLNLNAAQNRAQIQFWKGQYEKGLEMVKSILEIDPNYAVAHERMAEGYLQLGRGDQWLAEKDKYAQLTGDPNDLAEVGVMKRGYKSGGIGGAMKGAIQVREEQAKRMYMDPGRIAECYAYLGEKDKAFEWLEKALAEKSDSTQYLQVIPEWGPMRGDPRYLAVLKRMGLKQ
jgi:tetratricopeptide (TPR) repeat protein